MVDALEVHVKDQVGAVARDLAKRRKESGAFRPGFVTPDLDSAMRSHHDRYVAGKLRLCEHLRGAEPQLLVAALWHPEKLWCGYVGHLAEIGLVVDGDRYADFPDECTLCEARATQVSTTARGLYLFFLALCEECADRQGIKEPK